jgi:hypothetical protein
MGNQPSSGLMERRASRFQMGTSSDQYDGCLPACLPVARAERWASTSTTTTRTAHTGVSTSVPRIRRRGFASAPRLGRVSAGGIDWWAAR